MAEAMVREITLMMSGIELVSVTPGQMSEDGRHCDVVCGLVDGEHPIQVQFTAEPSLFLRLARNMIGGDPVDSAEVQEYAMEFFNVLCGRFLSELYRMAHIRIHNMTIPRYQMFSQTAKEGEEAMLTLRFISEEQEVAEFSWSMGPVEDMLRRNSNV